MTTRRVFSEPTPSDGRAAILQWADERSSGVPQSVLYLEPPSVNDGIVADQWDTYGSPIELRCERFRTLVDELYEADTYDGSATHISSAERQWIVEEALSRLTDTEHPLYSEEDPSVGLIQQSEELLTLLEFAGTITAEEVEQRLTQEGLPRLAQSLSRFVALVHQVRADGFDDAKTFRSERFRHVLDAGQPLVESELSTIEVVIVGSFQTLSPQERDIIGLIADAFDTGIVLTRVTDADELSGADDAIRRISRWYDELGFTPHETDGTSSRSPRERAAASLYEHEDGQAEPVQVGSDVTLETHATIQDEIRDVARTVRSLIGSGVDPSSITVAPFDEGTYGNRITDALRAADVPVVASSSRSLFATTTGKLFESVINLGTEPDRQGPLTRLLSNPLVAPNHRETVRNALQNADRLESTRVSTLAEYVDADTEAFIRDVVTACEEFVNATDIDSEREALLAELGVPTTENGAGLTDAIGFSRHVRAREQQAIERAAEVCSSLTERRDAADRDDADTDVEELRRALEQVTVETSVGRESDSVRVCSPAEAATNPAEYVFVPGLTTEHTPSPPRRLAFARPLNDSHPEFAASNPVAGTRYTFAQLIAADADLTLTAPQHNRNGDPYILADPVVELERVTGLEASSVNDRAPPASYTDVHRELAAAIDSNALTPDALSRNTDTYDINISGANASKRLSDGVSVAAERAADNVGDYDGHVDSGIVTALRGEDQPYSPSQLETYADCGFKYYLKYVLDIEPDDEITLELNALDAGTYVHDVLERFYRTWRGEGHDGVTEETVDEAEEVLYEVAASRLDELDARDTAFHDTWVTALFDGLTVPENRYGNADGPPGLFKRFLHSEAELAPRDATPSYFEAHVGLTPDEPGPEVLADDPVRVPGTDVQIRGKIDRLDITSDGGIVGMDYKTGSTASESDTIDGHTFQLPAYLLMAENALNGDPVGGSYYQVDPTDSISPHAGTVGSEEDAAHAYWGADDPAPLRRYQTLEFDTRGEFTEFLHDVIPDRIDRIAAAVDNGSFHPTVLSPDTAGCEYCPYRDACDVRHHRRHDIHDALTESNTPQYAPGIDTEDTQ
ncbi:PD-(D/E)XK nuclease family protein [Halolamina sp. CBA1230]|uniref:PD-(D/E)XK nuclease family protein n=1 Tax=Halolamina sp. CBA1230 TaxID=1853690 RepID=UPI0009A1B05A|nr:PD-(D/E)XK nuclease family protein [Halolamina sp. CBA1230]QKY19702.1 PD-(D/E)XK nuclease family protein [Halolamina sp. CBA1230]